MSNGLGAGFTGLTLLAVLAGLACLVGLATITLYALHRRVGRVPVSLRYLLLALLVSALAVSGFGVLALSDEAPAIAGLFALLVLSPLLVGGLYLDRTTELSRFDVAITTVIVWGPPFLVGVLVVFGTEIGIRSLFELAPAEARQMGIAWIASTIGGFVVVLGMLLLETRLRSLVGAVTTQ